MQTIKDIRQSTGLSQSQFSVALNIPKRTLPEYVSELIAYRVANDPTIPKVAE